jgi:hypothetical protein
MSGSDESIGPLSTWYFIRCDTEQLTLDVRTATPWRAEIRWDRIERICLVPGDLWSSDELIVFVKGRENSYVIPLEANGGAELISALPESVCPYDLRIAFATGAAGQQFWWPPLQG